MKKTNIPLHLSSATDEVEEQAEYYVVTEEKMSDKGMSKEITDAWAEFIKNSDKAKENILSAFDDDMEADGGMKNMILLGVRTLACILVAFFSGYTSALRPSWLIWSY